MFNPLSFFVTKPSKPQPKPVSNTNWKVEKAYNQRPADGCLTETLPNGKPWAYTLIQPVKSNQEQARNE